MERLDSTLVNRKLAPSRERAKELILAGQVLVNGRPAKKPSEQVFDEDNIEITGELLQYVSRGGLKLEKAIKAFDISVNGFVCCDIGASTGGFTDCLLQCGAAKVFSVDVGTAQLADKLRNDDRVVSIENLNARFLTLGDIQNTPVDFVCADTSFISLKLIIPPIFGILKDGGTAVLLIKPQFEAGKKDVGKKGVVKDKKVHERVVKEIREFAEGNGFDTLGICESPIKGPEGNIEFLIYFKKSGVKLG